MNPADPRDETVSRRGVLLAGLAAAGGSVAVGNRAAAQEAKGPSVSAPTMATHGNMREWTEHGGHAARFLFATVSRPSRTAALVTATR